MAFKTVPILFDRDNRGRVLKFLRNVRIGHDGCWLWVGPKLTGVNGVSYAACKVEGRTARAHRVSYALFYGAVPEHRHVLHSCDNKLCVNPEHLRLGDQSANSLDAVLSRDFFHARPRGQKGSSHRAAKLSEADIPLVLLMANLGHTNKAIADKFGVTDGSVSNIVLGQTWAHVAGDRAENGPSRYRVTPGQVSAIRKDWRPPCVAAKEYGISRGHFSAIRKRVRHKHIPDEP